MAYSINYTNLVYDNLPPDKRLPRHAKWLISLLSPLSWLKDLFFIDYWQGAVYPGYTPLTTYAKGDRVIWRRAVFMSLQNGNILHPIPQPGWWTKVQDNYMGLEERILYNGHKLVLEVALNKWMETTFRQLPGISDIYITTIAPTDLSFIAGADEPSSSWVGRTDSLGYVGDTLAQLPEDNFIINVPIAVYTALPHADELISSFAKQYVPVGIKFIIETY